MKLRCVMFFEMKKTTHDMLLFVVKKRFVHTYSEKPFWGWPEALAQNGNTCRIFKEWHLRKNTQNKILTKFLLSGAIGLLCLIAIFRISCLMDRSPTTLCMLSISIASCFRSTMNFAVTQLISCSTSWQNKNCCHSENNLHQLPQTFGKLRCKVRVETSAAQVSGSTCLGLKMSRR